jgi:AAA family ATP:ADP antiporter
MVSLERSMQSVIARLFDLREGESRVAFQAFATLFLVIAAHTTLETARDAIFLTKLPPSQLNVVYVVLAGATLVATAASRGLAARFGRRNALICSLVVAAYVTTFLYFLAARPGMALALYVFSGLVGAMLPLQFWLLAAQQFTVSQGRRLFGPIASGGVVGGTVGAGTAALALTRLSVTALLPIAALLFVVTAVLLTLQSVRTLEQSESSDTNDMPADAASPAAASPAVEKRPRTAVFRENPFLIRIAGLVALSTAAVLTIDYLFKSTAAHLIAPAALGGFFARYYAAMNGISLVVQVLIAGRIIRRIGVIGAAAVMPLLLIGGGASALLGGGVLFVVLGLKAIDGGLRYSLNRVATELLYLPLAPDARDRGKGVVDGVLSRIVQAATAAALYLLATHALATPRVLALIVLVLSGAWLALSISLRRPYLDLFRRALATGGIGPHVEIQELDLPSAEALVESLANPDPAIVIGAMRVLDQHRRTKLIPALVLYHEAEPVLIHALELFGASPRNDWIPMGEKLLAHSSDAVRIAAVRALAKHGKVEALATAAADPSSRVQAYAAFHLAHRQAEENLATNPLVSAIMQLPGDVGRQYRRDLLAAVSDAPDERAIELLIAFAQLPELDDDDDAIEQIAGAMAIVKSPRFIPVCIARLAKRAGREGIRQALVAMGEPALDALEKAIRSTEAGERRIRTHVPGSIARFASQRAADMLVDELERQTDGLVRYKVLRALGRLASAYDLRIDRRRIEKEVCKNLEEYLRLLSFHAALASSPPPAADGAGRLLEELIEDKLRQSMERAFRLLKIAHKREDIHRVHTAALSSDKRARASAGEFLDALLARRDQQSLRELLRVVVDEASDADRVGRASAAGRGLVLSQQQALAMLIDDRDDALAALAAHRALTLEDGGLRAVVARAGERRPSLRAMSEHLFGLLPPTIEATGG